MGCASSKPDDDVGGQEIGGGGGGGAKDDKGRLSFLNSSEGNNEQFREKLFASVGSVSTYKSGEKLITEGQTSEAAYFIKKGSVSLRKEGSAKEVAKRGKGDLIGEMSLLLGDVPGVSVVAEGTVEAYVMEHSTLVAMLLEDPQLSGRMFKMLATTISERITEASAKMRSEVVAKNAKKDESKKGGQKEMATLNLAKLRTLFQLPKDAALALRTTCSMRKEANALKDATVQFGDLYVFENHLCFDWKVFGFHQQQARERAARRAARPPAAPPRAPPAPLPPDVGPHPRRARAPRRAARPPPPAHRLSSRPHPQVLSLNEVVALLKSTEVPNTLEVQLKGLSYELTIPEDYEQAWLVMEECRRKTHAQSTLQASSEASTVGAAVYEEVDSAVEAAFEAPGNVRRASAGGPQGLNMELTEEDWKVFLAGAKQRKYKKGDYVLTEGMPTAALYQILQGTLRVELQLKDQPQAPHAAPAPARPCSAPAPLAPAPPDRAPHPP